MGSMSRHDPLGRIRPENLTNVIFKFEYENMRVRFGIFHISNMNNKEESVVTAHLFIITNKHTYQTILK